MRNTQSGNSVILTVLAVVLFAGLTGAAVYFWQNYEKEKALNLVKNDNAVVTQPDAVVEDETPVQESEENNPVVVYTPSGIFTASEKSEIQAKFVNPFIDWSKDIDQTVVSIEIEKPAEPVAGYAYEFTYINEGGGNGGFLFGTQTPLEWFLPTCMGGCNLSAEFQAKYPEIAAQVE